MKISLLLLLLTMCMGASAQVANPTSGAPAKDSVHYKPSVPQFPGGGEGLYQFIDDSLKYPAEALARKIEGTVVIQFYVGSDGNISNIKVLKGVEGGCTEEAIRVIKAMPRWEPGFKDGKAVGSQFNLPIMFQLPQNTIRKKD